MYRKLKHPTHPPGRAERFVMCWISFALHLCRLHKITYFPCSMESPNNGKFHRATKTQNCPLSDLSVTSSKRFPARHNEPIKSEAKCGGHNKKVDKHTHTHKKRHDRRHDARSISGHPVSVHHYIPLAYAGGGVFHCPLDVGPPALGSASKASVASSVHLQLGME